MFKLIDDPELIWWPVVIEQPADGGAVNKHKIECQFLLLDEDAYAEHAVQGDAKFIRHTLRDWKLVADEKGNDIPFSKKALGQLIARGYVQVAIVRAYNEMRLGYVRKN